MKNYLAIILCAVASLVCAQKRLSYPVAPKDSTFDKYFETIIKDPYQWMENPADPRLQTWVESQKQLTKKISNNHTRESNLHAQISALYHKSKREIADEYVNQKSEIKSKYVFEHKVPHHGRFPDLKYKLRGSYLKTLVKRSDFEYGKEDQITIEVKSVNEEHDLAAIEISHFGSDWREIFLFDLKTGKQLSDTLKNVRIGVNLEWDEKNIYYDRYSAPNEERKFLDKARGQKLCYHKFGTPQNDDEILYQNQDTTGTDVFEFYSLEEKIFINAPLKIRNNKIRVLSIAQTNSESFYLKNILAYPNIDSLEMQVIDLYGDSILVTTNWNAPNGKVLALDINQPNKLLEVIPELDITLWDVKKLGRNKVACTYRKYGNYMTLIFSMNGEFLKEMPFASGKKVDWFAEGEDETERAIFSVSSFYHPPLWYQMTLNDLEFKSIGSLSVPYDPNLLETRYVTYTSKDGTEIPMYITCRKDIELDGSNPTLMYGYGGYGITVEPQFNPSQALLLLYGGVLAMPNIRGGGSEGSAWGLEGRRLKKQNAIDDFIAAGEYLIAQGYTNPEKLAIKGRSHGGMLVGAAVTQSPELFKVAIAEAGPFDMLRKGLFTSATRAINISEYGVVSNHLDFNHLKSYSPLHNIKPQENYPDVLLITGDHDDRVPPHHSYKFLATLQEKANPNSTYIMYVVPGSGHGGALNIEDSTDKILFEYYFLLDRLGVDFY